MADTTNPLPSVNEPFVDRFRKINPAWLRWIKPLLETVKSTSTRIDTVTAEVDTMSVTVTETATAVATIGGSWGVAVTVNNTVVAAAKLDGSATDSAFRVLADKFIIQHPTDSGTPITPFVAQVISGTPTVRINGELVVDGSITADKLDINTLSEASADAGVIVNGTLKDSLDVYEFDIANGYFGRTDGSSYIDMKNNILQFTT